MLLRRSESTVLSADNFGQNVVGQGQVNDVQDPFSLAVGGEQVISLAGLATNQQVNLPVTTGAVLRIECSAPIQFRVNSPTGTLFTLVPPSPSAGGNPVTAVCLMMVAFTSLYLTNPTSSLVYVSVLAGGV